jgi:hypothetical protein
MADSPDIRWLGFGLLAIFVWFSFNDLSGTNTAGRDEPLQAKEIPKPKFDKFMGPAGPTVKVLYCFS